MSDTKKPTVGIMKKTKKVKKKTNKQELWSLFDTEVGGKKPDIECVYEKSSVKNRETCDICQSQITISEDGFNTCSNKKCGIIYKDNVDQTAEWRFYGADDNNSQDPTRCGMPVNPLLEESSYGCKVLCPMSSSYEMRKIRRYTEWQSMPYKEKSQYDEFQRISIMANNAGLPKIIIDEAHRYHKKISEQKTFRGHNRDGIIAAAIYISCSINNYPRTAKEIATIFYLDNTSATRGCKNAVSIINKMEQEMTNKDKTRFCKTRPIDFIERYCSRLNINQELTKVCQFIALLIEKKNLIPENTPHSVAAGVIYFVSQLCTLNVSKKDVNVISDISEVTINKCYKKLDSMRDVLIPKPILAKYCK